VSDKAKSKSPSQGQGRGGAVAAAAQTAASGEIHVKTSGLTFNEQTGWLRLPSALILNGAGTGSSTGATYDSKEGELVLDRAVELNTERAGEPVHIHAEHRSLSMRASNARCMWRGRNIAMVKLRPAIEDSFREDGSVIRLDAVNGFTMTTATGTFGSAQGRWTSTSTTSPHGHLEGGVKMDH